MSNQSFFAKNITSLSKIDFDKIKIVEDQISSTKELALEFINNPDAYMRKKMGSKNLPDNLHFHVSYKEKKYPSDTDAPENQIVLSSILTLNDSFKSEVLKELELLLEKQVDINYPMYCEGCQICKVSIIQ